MITTRDLLRRRTSLAGEACRRRRAPDAGVFGGIVPEATGPGFGWIAASIVEVEVGGLSSSDPSALPDQHVTRPIWLLDLEPAGHV